MTSGGPGARQASLQASRTSAFAAISPLPRHAFETLMPDVHEQDYLPNHVITIQGF